MIPVRAEVPKEHQWNVEAMYHSVEEWQKNLERYRGRDVSPKWPELFGFKGRLAESPSVLADALKVYFNIDRVLSKIYTYSHLRYDQDLGNEENKKNYSSAMSLLHDFQMEASWIEPELLTISDKDFEHLIKSDHLKDYRFFLERVYRMRNHTLSENEEMLLSLSGKTLDTVQKTFSAFNNADLKFPNVLDKDGKSLPMSNGLYLFYMKSPDRVLRKNAYDSMLKNYLAFENTLCELISGQVENHIYMAKARKYDSSLEAALFPHKIDISVYSNLVDSVRKHLGTLHKYVSLRKKALGVAELKAYDLYVPLVEERDFQMNYEPARDLVLEAVKPLGAPYCEALRKGVYNDRWVDIYENQRKRSGAYSSGCYDSMPYILMNYHGTINDVFTLAHEIGHSMHSYLSNKNQPYQYSQYPIFVAEVASTFNEQLLLRLLLDKAKDKKERAYLINYAIDGIRGTLFRQTQFAEFELKIHQWKEKGIPLTPDFLKKEYRKLNQEYYGPDLALDDEIAIEWARIPHFYYNFYVYQYATGISAALALVQGVLADPKKKDDYLRFLSSGGSRYPIDLLKIAGVDMHSSAPIDAALEHFAKLVDELEQLLD